MNIKQVNIDGADYVPLAMLHLLAEPATKEAAALISAAINMARADDRVDHEGGSARLDDATTKLKRAVRAFERLAAAR